MEDPRLQRIEDKLDRVLEHVQTNSNRITKLETQAGFVQAALALLVPFVIWVLNKLYPQH